ncbi:hypothetical protein [Tenacibaculum piscium]|uniref:hypothetical protein n=1 Tax=Tenacibaculum piscium TaxID=1458515 RepID=UPI001F368281|nr:hypothetical protein [Tenacibaculum piscium]
MSKIVKQIGTIDKQLNKNEILNLSRQNAESIIANKNYDLLKVYVELKRYETYLKGLIQSLKIPALESASQIGKKTFEYQQAKINISSRTKWNFNSDKTWYEINDKIQFLTKQRKEREKYLKENNSQMVVDETTGEIIEELELPKQITKGLTIRL